ncbi:DUF6281 family protein [Streptomyces sp. NPDC060006]|uniref:DUF6281 family protein n=1 Tax=unclassified Streptomyces TaxID=2593676 RepID=UPI003634AB24
MKAAPGIVRTGPVWALLLAVLVTVSVACTSSSNNDGGESSAACAYQAKFQSRTYSGVAVRNFTVGNRLGAATVPPCNDTPNDDSDGRTKPTSTTAYAIKGVDPSIAITLEQAPDDVILVNADSHTKLPQIKAMIQNS